MGADGDQRDRPWGGGSGHVSAFLSMTTNASCVSVSVNCISFWCHLYGGPQPAICHPISVRVDDEHAERVC